MCLSRKTSLYSDRDVTVSLIFERILGISETEKNILKKVEEKAKIKSLG